MSFLYTFEQPVDGFLTCFTASEFLQVDDGQEFEGINTSFGSSAECYIGIIVLLIVV